jgi:2,3-bisphosphoglycerate-independent phosphoglycerate mutase
MKILFLFMDGVGLGNADPDINPFNRQEMPYLEQLLNGHNLVFSPHLPLITERATLLALDACLGVPGLPQSATGQASILTGDNIAAQLGYHYGPKPNPPIREILSNRNLFSRLKDLGLDFTMVNAYPPNYFSSIESGRRIYSAFPLAVTNAGMPLKNYDDLIAGNALSADFSAHGWHEHLDLIDAPLLSESEAGTLLAKLSNSQNFTLFEYWLSDYAGHRQDIQQAGVLLTSFDKVLGSLLENWNDDEGLIILTSDHGNLEDMHTRRHTKNPVPALIIGNPDLRQLFIHLMYAASGPQEYLDLACLAPALLAFLSEKEKL